MKQDGICTVISESGVSYAVRPHFTAPNRYVAHVTNPVSEPLHYDGMTLAACLSLIGAHIERNERTLSAVLKAVGIKGT